MSQIWPRLCVAWIASVLVAATCFAQPQRVAAVLQGEGAFLRGAGSYNLNTAQANSINTDTVIRWKQDLRRIEAERRDLLARKEAGKKLRIEEVKRQQQLHQLQLRTEPTSEDIQSGEALNVLLYDLSDPDITAADWSSHSVKLPPEMSVKDLIFRFTPYSNSSSTSTALSRGVIALSRLSVEGREWPTALKQPELQNERRAFESAYGSLKDQLVNDQFNPKSLTSLDQSLENLKSKVQSAVPKERGFREEAAKYVEELKASTRMFDASTVDYAREILIDTQENDATTVGELVGFMLKYRLQFASAERSASARSLYVELYQLMHQQGQLLGLKPAQQSPLSDLDRVATGKWFPLVDAKTVLPDPQKMKIQNGVLELEEARLEFPKIRAQDAVIRAKVRVVTAHNGAISLRRDDGHFGAFCGGPYQANGDFFGIGKHGSGKWTDLGVLHTGRKIQPDEFVDMAFSAVGQTLTLYLNGTVALTVKHEQVTSGIVFVSAHKGKCQFKDLEYQILDNVPAIKAK